MRILIIAIAICIPFNWLSAKSLSEDLLRESGIVETNLVREGCMGAMTVPVGRLIEKREYYAFRGGEQRVLFKVVIKRKSAFFLFINETPSGYTEWGRGHYVIKRSRVTGRFESIGIPFRDDPGCYLEIIPRDGLTLMTVYLFGVIIYQEVHLASTLEALLTAPFSSIIDMSQGVVDWSSLLYRGGRPEDRLVQDLVTAIERELPRVRETEDGAINARGEFVTIRDEKKQEGRGGLNCSGFMKWIVDGLYHPLTGFLLDIDGLKERHPDRRGTRWSARNEEITDAYFGLDWTRNLATRLAAAQTGGSRPDIEAADVRRVPFLDYREDLGYRVRDLKVLLYFLSIEEPGTAYLATVNGIYNKNPLRQEYFHVATLFPYFDGQGRFHMTVMDQHKDPDIDDFMKKYATNDIHLVRIRLGGDFSLFHIE